MQKKLPNSYYKQEPDMYFTTTGQVIAPTTSSVESEVKPLPPINNPQSEPPHTDCGDAYAINDPSKLESQQNVEN